MSQSRHLPNQVLISAFIHEKFRDKLDRVGNSLGHKDRSTTIREAVYEYLKSHENDLKDNHEVEET